MSSAAETQSRLEAALVGRYAIERELGRGGAATVYLAHDLKHRRQVALKVLRSDVAAALGADRFLREIEIAARLSHPHILPLHDSGTAGGFLFYVMPYIEGESLRDRLKREHQLPVAEAVRIAQEVANALAYAHSQHVVHRDIKPENILLSAGEAVVADFGIARAVRAAGGEKLTETGMALGTPAYMSPEQTGGGPEPDGRSDLYSLGCVVYEMLAGAPPFGGTTAQQVMARHALDPVPPLRTIRPELPEAIDRAVRQALAKAPADRFATVADFSTALTEPTRAPIAARRATRLTLLVAGGVGVLTAAYLFLSRRSVFGEQARSVAVLAFENVGGDPTNEPFSDGMADELTTALGKVEGLTVTARTSAFSFRRRGLDAREIGRQLQVRYLVEGTVRAAASRRKVSAQLIDVATGKEVWSDTFEHDAKPGDVFAVEDSITRAIMRELRVRLSSGTTALLAKPSTASPEAHDLYLQGRYFFAKQDLGSIPKARTYFERAIEKDSSYALAYAGLSDAYNLSGGADFPPRDVFPKAKVAVQRALALDPTLVEAHASQGFISLFYDWDWPVAGREFDRALALDPRYPLAHLYRGWYLLATDRMKEAVAEFRAAVQLDPFSLRNNTRLATILFYARRYDEALAQGRRVLELDSTYFQARGEIGRAYLELGRCDEALAAYEGGPEQTYTNGRGLLGYAYGRCGYRAKALAQLDHLAAIVKQGQYVSHYAFAMIHAGLGDADRTFAELDSAYAERAWPMFTLRVQPEFSKLRSDPRFAALLKKVGLTS